MFIEMMKLGFFGTQIFVAKDWKRKIIVSKMIIYELFAKHKKCHSYAFLFFKSEVELRLHLLIVIKLQ